MTQQETPPIVSPAGPRGWTVALRFAALALVWGSSFLLTKLALVGLGPLQIAGGRIVLGALALVAIMLVTRRRWPRNPAVWGHLAVAAVLLCVVPYSLFAWAGQHIPSGISSIINALTPVMTLLVGLVALPDERLTRTRALGILVATLGVVLVAAPWTLTDLDGALGILGQLACLAAATCYGLGLVYTRRFIRHRGEDATSVAAVQLTIAAAIVLVIAPFVAMQPVRLDPVVIGAIVVLGVVGTGIATVWNTTVIQVWGATASATVTYLIPIVGVVLGVLVLGEVLTWNEVLGAVAVLLGVMLSQGVFGQTVLRHGPPRPWRRPRPAEPGPAPE